jgi:isoquinoline 1-oxidoreductase beta subunit
VAESFTRRSFLRTAAQSLAGLWIACSADLTTLAAATPDSVHLDTVFRPSAYLHIASTGEITFYITRSEMGQGIRTALPSVVGEELDVDPSTLILRQASLTPEFAKIRLRTSGSGSSTGTWKALRRAGATARQMLLTAAAQAWNVPASECSTRDAFVLHPVTGRRSSYASLAEAAARLPVPQDVRLKANSDFRFIGTRRKRVDSPQIVRGEAKYGLDVALPGMRYAVAVRSPVFGEKPARWDSAAALKIPGVHEVVELESGLARCVAVTADSPWQAIVARDALEVEWSEGEHRSFSTYDFYQQLREALVQPNAYFSRSEGDYKLAVEQAAETFEAAYEWPLQAHCCMEPMNCTADVHNGECEIWVPTQAPEEARDRSAKLLGIAPERVRVNITLLGGGFGRRLYTDYVVEAVELSHKIGKPVQLFWTRDDDMKFGHFNPPNFNRLVATFDAQHSLTGIFHRVASSDLSIYPPTSDDPLRYAKDGDPWGGYDNPYNFRALRVEYVPCASPVPTGPWRSVDYPGAVFARESFLDEIALRLRIDPIELRLQLLEPRREFTLGDQKIDRGRLAKVLEVVREMSNWSAPVPVLKNRRCGRGIACNVYDSESYIAHVAEVSVGETGDIRVHRIVCAVDLGQVINPLGVEGQVESGIAWGLTSTLKSTMRFQNGQAQSSNFADYELLRFDEMPEIETHIVSSIQSPCGLGEQPVPPVAPSVANAVFAATGKRLRSLPLSLI